MKLKVLVPNFWLDYWVHIFTPKPLVLAPFLVLSSPEDMFIDFRERGKQGERGRETEPSFGCFPYALLPGMPHTAQTCVLTGNQTRDLLVCGATPNPLSHTGRGSCSIF